MSGYPLILRWRRFFVIQLHLRRVVELCLKLLTLFAMTALKPPSRPLG